MKVMEVTRGGEIELRVMKKYVQSCIIRHGLAQYFLAIASNKHNVSYSFRRMLCRRLGEQIDVLSVLT
jgi:hypothetical protein